MNKMIQHAQLLLCVWVFFFAIIGVKLQEADCPLSCPSESNGCTVIEKTSRDALTIITTTICKLDGKNITEQQTSRPNPNPSVRFNRHFHGSRSSTNSVPSSYGTFSSNPGRFPSTFGNFPSDVGSFSSGFGRLPSLPGSFSSGFERFPPNFPFNFERLPPNFGRFPPAFGAPSNPGDYPTSFENIPTNPNHINLDSLENLPSAQGSENIPPLDSMANPNTPVPNNPSPVEPEESEKLPPLDSMVNNANNPVVNNQSTIDPTQESNDIPELVGGSMPSNAMSGGDNLGSNANKIPSAESNEAEIGSNVPAEKKKRSDYGSYDSAESRSSEESRSSAESRSSEERTWS